MVATLPGVRVNARVQLVFDSDPEYRQHSTRIERFEGDVLYLLVPLRRGGIPVWGTVGEGVEVVIDPVDAQSPQLFLQGQLIGRQTDPDELVIVQIIAAGALQRRTYYRLPVRILPVDCSLWAREFGQPESSGSWEALSGIIVNLSGGGIGMEVDRELLDGARLHVRFPLPTSEGTLGLDLTVKNVKPVSAGREVPRYYVGCEFRALMPQQRARILHCVHRYQLEDKKREIEHERSRVALGQAEAAGGETVASE